MDQDVNASTASPHQRYTLRFERFDAFVAEYTSLLSLGGMFLKTESPSPKGSIVAFDVKLADGFRLFQGTGEVVWTRSQSTGSGLEPGLGVRFQALNEEGRQLILKILEEQVKGGGQPFDVDEVPADVAQAANTPIPLMDPAAATSVAVSAASAASTGTYGKDVMAALGAPGLGGDEVSEEITMVSQRGLGVGPSQKIDFSTPFGGLSDDMPVGLFDADPDDGESQPGAPQPVAQPSVPQSSSAASPAAVPSGLENPFAMPEADFDDLDDLPDLDVDDGLLLEPDAEVQFDRTLASATAPPAEIPVALAETPAAAAPPVLDVGTSDTPSALGVEFETGSEMSLELDEGPALDGPVLLFGAAAEQDDDDEEPTMVGTQRGAEDLLAASPVRDPEPEVGFANPSSDLDDGTSVSAFDLPEDEPASTPEAPFLEAPSLAASAADVEAPAPLPAPGFEPIDTGAPPFDSAALAATEAATLGPSSASDDGLSTAPWSMPMPAEADGPIQSLEASSDPFATHAPDGLDAPDAPPASVKPPRTFEEMAAASADGPSPHDSTEILEVAPALETVGQWEAMDTADVPGAIAVPPSAEGDLAAIDASPFGVQDDASLFGVQDYDLDAPPPPSGWKGKLGGARNLLISLVLVLLVGAGYFFRHDLASLIGLGPSDGNMPPTVGAIRPDLDNETAEDDAYGEDAYGEDAYGEDAYGDADTVDAGTPDPGTSNDDAPDTVDVAAPVTVASAPPPPVAAPPTVTAPPARRSPPPAASRGGGSATQVLDIQVRPGQGGTQVIILLDGDFSDGDVIHDPLGYNALREQIRLLGLELPYRQNTIQAGTSELSQIRTGLHAAGSDASELRLVFDLAAEGLSAANYQVLGDRIEILVR